MNKQAQILLLILLSSLAVISANAQKNVVTANSAGKVTLGMPVAEVRKAVAPMRLSRSSDGEGIALILIKRGSVNVMTLYAGEEDQAGRINEKALVEQIWVLDKTYKTAAGVHPGMLVSNAEKRLGKVKEIMMSEIESREFAEFTDHPKGIDFRLRGKDRSAGVYAPRSSKSTSYTPGAYIFSINLTGRDGSSTGTASKFSSQYTDLKTGCKTVGGNEGGHVSTFCKGPAGYQIHYFDTATTLEFNAENEKESFQARLGSEALDYISRSSKIEWRLADGEPFAVIMRVYQYPVGGEFPKERKPIGEFLIVKGLKGHESIDSRIYAKTANANEKAREAADNAYGTTGASAESLDELAGKFIPTGDKLAHQVVEGTFGPFKDAVVVLYGKDYPAMMYSGVVLTPDTGGHKKLELPRPNLYWSIEEPKAVFFANADSDKELELFILGECYTGIGPTGALPFYRTRVYDWTGNGFSHLDAVSNEIGFMGTAAAIRKQLPAIVKRSEKAFQPMDVAELNKKLAGNKGSNTPLRVISHLVDPFEEMLSRSITINVESIEAADSLKVVVTDDGYADDSVRGAQYKFDLQKNTEGEWRVVAASKAWRCQQGRGHKGFLSKPCL